MRLRIGIELSYFCSEAMIMYFRAFEVRYTDISYSFMPKLTLHRPDWSSNQSKIALETVDFGLCEDLKDILHILNPLILILWI